MKPLPKAGIFADHQGDEVSQRIACKINGITPKMKFDGSSSRFIELGEGRVGYASGNFSPNLNRGDYEKAFCYQALGKNAV